MSALLGRDVKYATTSLQTLKPSQQDSSWKEDNVDALSAKRSRYDREATLPKFGFRPEEKSAVQSSYEVAHRIANCKKPHTIAEDIIKPCAEKMVELMIGPEAKKKIHQVSLSNDMNWRRIDIAADVCRQVWSKIKQSTLQASLQLAESTDTVLDSQFIAFYRYERKGEMKEEFLFCSALPTTTTAADILSWTLF